MPIRAAGVAVSGGRRSGRTIRRRDGVEPLHQQGGEAGPRHLECEPEPEDTLADCEGEQREASATLGQRRPEANGEEDGERREETEERVEDDRER